MGHPEWPRAYKYHKGTEFYLWLCPKHIPLWRPSLSKIIQNYEHIENEEENIIHYKVFNAEIIQTSQNLRKII